MENGLSSYQKQAPFTPFPASSLPDLFLLLFLYDLDTEPHRKKDPFACHTMPPSCGISLAFALSLSQPLGIIFQLLFPIFLALFHSKVTTAKRRQKFSKQFKWLTPPRNSSQGHSSNKGKCSQHPRAGDSDHDHDIH